MAFIKESIEKGKCNHQSFPKKIKSDGKKITDENLIAKQFSIYFTEIGLKLAKTIQASSLNFASFMENSNSTQAESTLTVNELKEMFFLLKINKSSCYDGISLNVVRSCFGPLLNPLMAIFNLSLQKGCFPEELKIARVTSIYRADDVNEIGNYRLISVLSCFSKVLEKMMYNRLFKYLPTNEMFSKKQFGFQKRHSAEHETIQLID